MLTHYTGETEPFHRAVPASKSIAAATGKRLSRAANAEKGTRSVGIAASTILTAVLPPKSAHSRRDFQPTFCKLNNAASCPPHFAYGFKTGVAESVSNSR